MWGGFAEGSPHRTADWYIIAAKPCRQIGLMANAFQIGPWVAKPSLNTLSLNGKTIHIEPKVMEVLVCLADEGGETISKEKLLETVWPGTFVTDDVLTRCISELRRVFEDNPKKSRFIQTIPKRGYRLIPPVGLIGQSPQSPVPSVGREVSAVVENHYSRWLARTGIVVAILLIGSLSFLGVVRWWPRSTEIPQIRSLAVLPLQNLSDDPAQEYFSDGMTDALITELARVASLKVISRTSSMRYKGTAKSLPDIARELNVDGIIEGTVQRSGNCVRVTAQLIHGRSDKHLWAQSYERDLHDTLQVEREIAYDAVAGISASMGTVPVQPLASRYPLNTDAYDDYLKGRAYVRRFAQNDIIEGMKLLERSIARDPNYAPAYSELSYGYQMLAMLNQSPPQEVLPKAKEASLKALALDQNEGEAHSSLGMIYGQFEWNWRGEERELKRALELDSNSALTHERYADYLTTQRRNAEAVREINTALELDPFSPTAHSTASYVLRAAHQYDLALSEARRCLEIDPDYPFGHSILAATLASVGKQDEAFQEWLRYLRLNGDGEVARRLEAGAKNLSGPGDPGRRLGHITLAYYQEKMKTHYVGALTIAEAYMDLGDRDRMFDWLNKAYDEHAVGLYNIAVEPLSDSLRAEPRYQDLLRRMNLPVDSSN